MELSTCVIHSSPKLISAENGRPGRTYGYVAYEAKDRIDFTEPNELSTVQYPKSRNHNPNEKYT
jgi:hypothetical protein